MPTKHPPPITHYRIYTTRQIPHGCRHSPRVHARHVRPGIHNPPVCPKINHSLRCLTISLTASESPVCRQHWSFIFNPLRLYAVFILFTFATRGCHKMWIENRVIHIVGITVWITHMIIHILGIILWIAWGQSTAAAISICICSINVLQGATPMTRASTLATSCDQTSTNTHQHPLASTITTSVRTFAGVRKSERKENREALTRRNRVRQHEYDGTSQFKTRRNPRNLERRTIRQSSRSFWADRFAPHDSDRREQAPVSRLFAAYSTSLASHTTIYSDCWRQRQKYRM